MGDDPHPEAEGKAPANRELTWACVSTDPSRYVFYADADVSSFTEGVVCKRLDQVEMTAKTAFYVVKALKELGLAVP